MLRIDNLTKDYGKGAGIHGISATIDTGEIVAVVGPNGAGKSTLFAILARILQPSGGSWSLGGVESSRIEACSLGFAGDSPLLFARLSAFDSILFDATMRGIVASPDTIERQAAAFGLTEHLGKRIKHLSFGSRRKVSLLCALQGSPRLIILDEPLNGLDIASVLHLKELLREQRAAGATILIASHLLTFLDGLADRILFLKDGRLAQVHANPTVSAETVFRELYYSEKSNIAVDR